jgi:hypothetical protein
VLDHAAPAAAVALAALLGDRAEPLPAAVLDRDRGAVVAAVKVTSTSVASLRSKRRCQR